MTSINNSSFKEEMYLRSITTLKIFEFENKEHQDIFFSDTYSAIIFTPSIIILKLKQKDVQESLEEVFEDFLIDVLYEHSGYKYIDDDIAIVITPEEDLKALFKENYKKDYVYFISLVDNLFFIFDE